MDISPPLFDPELAAALAATGMSSVGTGLTLGTAQQALLDDVAAIAAAGFEVAERQVPGAKAAPRSRCSSSALRR